MPRGKDSSSKSNKKKRKSPNLINNDKHNLHEIKSKKLFDNIYLVEKDNQSSINKESKLRHTSNQNTSKRETNSKDKEQYFKISESTTISKNDENNSKHLSNVTSKRESISKDKEHHSKNIISESKNISKKDENTS